VEDINMSELIKDKPDYLNIGREYDKLLERCELAEETAVDLIKEVSYLKNRLQARDDWIATISKTGLDLISAGGSWVEEDL